MTKPTTTKIIDDLEDWNRKLEVPLAALINAATRLRELERENAELRELLAENDGDTPASDPVDPGLAYSEAIRLGRSGSKP